MRTWDYRSLFCAPSFFSEVLGEAPASLFWYTGLFTVVLADMVLMYFHTVVVANEIACSDKLETGRAYLSVPFLWQKVSIRASTYTSLKKKSFI